MTSPSARAAIIGAGSSGITAAQVLLARGISVDVFEIGSQVGGNWRYDNDNGLSSAYRSLHINTSRQMMEYAAYPMPEDLPDYPNHWQIAQYFDDFVDHFGFRDRIRFRTEVAKVAPRSDGYDVTIRTRNEHNEPSEPETLHYAERHRGQRSPLGPAMAGAVVPGQRDLPRHPDPRPLLQDTRDPRGQARAGPGHRQLRDRHRGGGLAGRREDLSGDAARGTHRAEVHLRDAHRPPHRRPGGADAAAGAAGR